MKLERHRKGVGNMSLESHNATIIASVIIPAYNRRPILEKALKALTCQTYPNNQFEVIVIDDGSNDGTDEMVKSMMEGPVNIRYYYQSQKGPAAARNRGIKAAKGSIIIFIDSDIVVCPEFIEKHMQCQKSNNVIAHGPVIHTSDFDNPTEAEEKITDIARAFFATGNVSIRKEALIKAGLFDDNFKEYGWEDLEMGIRLRKLNLTAVKCEDAPGYHYKPKLALKHLESLKERERQRGHTAIILYKKHPTFKVRMMILLTPIFFILDRLLTIGNWPDWDVTQRYLKYLEKRSSHLALRFIVRIITNHSYALGLKEGVNHLMPKGGGL